MAVRQYIGARYIPLFSDPIEWSASTSYEPLTVVTYQGGSYVSRQYVPAGIPLNNTDYWLLWADYNAQLEAYRKEVLRFDGRITANADAIADETEARTAADTTLGDDIAAETLARQEADTALNDDIAAETLARQEADTAIENNLSSLRKLEGIESAVKMGFVGCFTSYGFTGGTYDALNILPFRGQGFTLNNDKQGTCFLVADDHNSFRVCTFDMESNTFSINPNVYPISGTSMGNVLYLDNFYYVAGYDTLQIYNQSFTLVREIAKPSSFSGYCNPVIDRKTDDIYAVDTITGALARFNGNTLELLDYRLNPTPAALVGTYIQACAAYDGLLYVAIGALYHKEESGILVYDIATGKFVKFMSLIDDDTNILPIDEPESLDFTSDGTMIVFARSVTPYSTHELGLVHTLWRYNVNTGFGNNGTVTSYASCVCVKDGNNLYSAPGSTAKEAVSEGICFKSLAEASLYSFKHPYSYIHLYGSGTTPYIYYGQLNLCNNAYVIPGSTEVYICGMVRFNRGCNATVSYGRLRVFPLQGFNYTESGLYTFDSGCKAMISLANPSAPSIAGTPAMNSGYVYYIQTQAVVDIAINIALTVSGFTYQSICNQSASTQQGEQARGRGIQVGFANNTFPTA